MPAPRVRTIRVELPSQPDVRIIEVSNLGRGSSSSFNSFEVARVEPEFGDDETGQIGNLLFPFETTQGAIDAFELLDPLPSNPIIEIGGNAVRGFTTILPYLTVVGVNGLETTGSQRTASAITSNITMSATDGPEANTVVLILKNIWSNKSITFNGVAPNTELDLINSAILGGAISASLGVNGVLAIYGTSVSESLSRVENVALQGSGTTQIQLYDILVRGGILSFGDGTDAYLTRCVVAGSVAASINNLYLADSFITGTNAAGSTSYSGNVQFDPANWDFSTLPTSNPLVAGKVWVDTANGFVIKVSQG